MIVLKMLGLVVGLLVLALVGLVFFGQVLGSRYGLVLVIGCFLVLSVAGTFIQFRMADRRDKFSKELTDTWGRVRDTKEPGVERDELTR